MAQYSRYNQYNFERFEPKTVSTGSAAPKIEQLPKNKPQIRLVEKPKISASELRAQSHAAGVKAVKIFAISVAILMFMAAVIFSRVQLDEINRDIKAMDTSITNAKSDTVRLNMELDSQISIDKVEDYAINNLGMVKVQDYQVVYVDLSSEDMVVKSDAVTNDVDSVIKSTEK